MQLRKQMMMLEEAAAYVLMSQTLQITLLSLHASATAQ